MTRASRSPAAHNNAAPLTLRSMQLFLRSCLLLCAFAANIFSRQDHSQPRALYPADFRFDGDWQCTGTFPSNGKPHRSSFHGESSGDGKWLGLTETDIEPKGYVGHYQFIADPSGAKLIFLDVNSAGYAIFESPGWNGHTLTLTSTETHYAKAFPNNRFIYTIHDARHFSVEWQVERAAAWISGDLLHCSAQNE